MTVDGDNDIRVTLIELANAVDGTVRGSETTIITGAADVDAAGPGDIVLAENEKYFARAEASDAGAIVTSGEFTGVKPVVIVSNPRLAFAEALRIFAPKESLPAVGIHPSCLTGERISCGKDVRVGYGCHLGNDVVIGESSVIFPFVYIGDGVRIGDGAVIRPHVTIYSRCVLGSRVIVHSGAVVGSDGFGYFPCDGELQKYPHIGIVVIEDDVEIGANTTIDRAKTGETRIGRGTKIDNLVQIAHNVKIGKYCVIVAQAGLGGSTVIGDGVTIAGQAGLRDHVTIGDGAVIAGGSGVFGDIPADETYSGWPARPHKKQMRIHAAMSHLTEMKTDVESLKEEIEFLKERLAALDGEPVE